MVFLCSNLKFVDRFEFGSTRWVFRLSLSTRYPCGRSLVETGAMSSRPTTDQGGTGDLSWLDSLDPEIERHSSPDRTCSARGASEIQDSLCQPKKSNSIKRTHYRIQSRIRDCPSAERAASAASVADETYAPMVRDESLVTTTQSSVPGFLRRKIRRMKSVAPPTANPART